MTALAGMSGTGESSLISAVQPGLDLRVAEVGGSGEGRHTTTQATMLGLEGGGFVVDTPGVREFGLAGLRRLQLAGFYPEIGLTRSQLPLQRLRSSRRTGVRSERRAGAWRRACKSLPVLPSDPRDASGIVGLWMTRGVSRGCCLWTLGGTWDSQG